MFPDEVLLIYGSIVGQVARWNQTFLEKSAGAIHSRNSTALVNHCSSNFKLHTLEEIFTCRMKLYCRPKCEKQVRMSSDHFQKFCLNLSDMPWLLLMTFCSYCPKNRITARLSIVNCLLLYNAHRCFRHPVVCN